VLFTYEIDLVPDINELQMFKHWNKVANIPIALDWVRKNWPMSNSALNRWVKTDNLRQ